ncbi:MAG: hydrogen gas-evolving membrane-bound hydrogenase subunit E [Roseibacillus sp.]
MSSPLILLALPILCLLLFAVGNRLPKRLQNLVGVLTALIFGCGAAWLIAFDLKGESILVDKPWASELGIDWALRLTPFTAWFGALILGLGACIQLYACYYFEKKPGRFTLMSYLAIFTSAMLGVIWADNFYLLFLFWEATSLFSFLLVGFHHQHEKTRENASQAMLITLGGGAALLAGFILLQQGFGTAKISELLSQEALPEGGVVTAGMLLVMIGALTKSAQWPFHFWLPNAMVGPTPVSAFLHSATMVKAGVFLLATLAPMMSQHPLWTPLLATSGILTIGTAVARAMREDDLKSILASTTLAALGFLTILAAIGTPAAQLGFVIFLTAHALYKAPLFLAAGNLEIRFGTRRLSMLKGAFHTAKITGLVIIVSVASLLGVAPLPGFLGKEYLLKATWYHSPLLAIAVAIAAAGVLGLGLRTVIPMLSRQDRVEPKRDLPLPLAIAMILPALGALLLTFSLPLSSHNFLGPAATALGAEAEASYKLWHGWTPALGLGISALLLSLFVAKVLSRPNLPPLPNLFLPLFENLFNLGIEALRNLAKQIGKLLEKGSLQSHLALMLVAIGSLVFLSLQPQTWPKIQFGADSNAIAFLCLAPLIACAAIVAARTRETLPLLVSLGFVGLLVAFLFLWFSAPDLALTQLLAETLTLFLLAVALIKSRTSAQEQHPKESVSKFLRVGIATASGVLVTALILKAIALDWDHPISDFHLAESKPSAYGANVVNVILVDFRALDTLGELTVLVIAALGANAALGAARTRAEIPGQSTPWIGTGLTAIISILVVTAGWLFWRGHNYSGGGFVAALILASAFGLAILFQRGRLTPPKLRKLSRGLLVAGLIISCISALLPLLIGKTFFTGLWYHRGDFHLGTPLLFDLGVMLSVLGFALNYLRHFYIPRPL